MSKTKLSKKTLKKMQKLGLKAGAVVVQETIRPPKPSRKFLKAFGLKVW